MSDLYFSKPARFSEFDRLQREMASLFSGLPSSIRSGRSGATFPVRQHRGHRRLDRELSRSRRA